MWELKQEAFIHLFIPGFSLFLTFFSRQASLLFHEFLSNIFSHLLLMKPPGCIFSPALSPADCKHVGVLFGTQSSGAGDSAIGELLGPSCCAPKLLGHCAFCPATELSVDACLVFIS